MALFGWKKKQPARETPARCECGGMCKPSETTAEKPAPQGESCCCNSACNAETMAHAQAENATGAAVKVLGSGCDKCNRLTAATQQALAELGMDTTVDHVTDFARIAAYGVMTTPALVVNGTVVSYGKVLKKEEVIALLKKSCE